MAQSEIAAAEIAFDGYADTTVMGGGDPDAGLLCVGIEVAFTGVCIVTDRGKLAGLRVATDILINIITAFN